MGKRIWYSRPLASIWELYQKANKNGDLTPQKYTNELVKSVIRNRALDEEYIQTQIQISDMFYADATMSFLHLYFVDKSLRDFLISVPLADFDGLVQFVKEQGEDVDYGVISEFGQTVKIDSKIKKLIFGIHIPYEKAEKGYAFDFTINEEGKLLFSWHKGDFAGYISADEYKELGNDTESEEVKKLFALAVNTIVYMKTFPHCVVEGVPKILKEERAFRIEIAEKVLDMENHSGKTVSPHFRRGYFKRLTSDFYTHKKGQTVFVKETMVKGKAKTIYTADNLEEIYEG